MSEWKILETPHGKYYKHSCSSCKNTTLIPLVPADGTESVIAFCCGRQVEAPKETWFNRLPREKVAPQRVRPLRVPEIDF
jgi:hypothetical protein